MADEAPKEPAPAPEPEKVEEQWLAPPIGGETKKYEPSQEKIDPKDLEMVVDRITFGIKQIWHAIAVWQNEPVWEHSDTDMWGYSIVVGFIVKKYAKNSELVLLAVGIMAILTVETMKAMEIAKRRRFNASKGGMPAEIPKGALA